MSLTRLLLSTAVLLAAAQAAVAAGPSASSKHVTVTLVPEVESIQPGRPFTVALRMQMEPEWHTYWKNPGDSGLPTRIQWRLPEGFEAGEIQWPTPETMYVEPLMSYGYGGEVLLLTDIRPPAALAGGDVMISAKVDWLECKEACLPGKAELEISVPVRDAEPLPVAAWKDAFAATRRQIPVAATGWSFEAEVSPSAVALVAKGPVAGSAKNAYLFPATVQVIDHAAPQKLSPAPGGFRLEMQRAPNAPAPDALTGVLVVDGRAFEIAAGAPRAAAVGALEPPRPAAIEAASSAATPDLATPTGGATSTATAAGAPGAQATTLPIALLFAFVGGMILNLMPCVLPVLSLKVMGFVRDGQGNPHGAIRHGFAFAAGVVVFFWVLAGVLLALRAGGEQIGWGFQLQSPVFVMLLSALFLLLSLNLFGVFEVGASLTAVGNVPVASSGLASSFWSGALATIVATPCTAPFMGSALGFTLSQPAAITFLVFTMLGLGMASPYLVLSASPRLLKLVPKPGAWMETFKQLMGFVLLATVVFLAWLFGRQVGVGGMAWLLVSLLLLSMGGWVYGRGTTPLASGRQRALALTAAAVLALSGVAVGMAQARSATAEKRQAAEDGWEAFSPERLAELRRAGTPVFVDFTADWCLTCQVNKRIALNRAEVRERFAGEGVVLMKADWTLRDETITRALAEHGRQGVPLYVLYGRDASQPPRILPEVLSPAIVLGALEEAL
jgi:thiol:disulfide interchange protein DsbD